MTTVEASLGASGIKSLGNVFATPSSGGTTTTLTTTTRRAVSAVTLSSASPPPRTLTPDASALASALEAVAAATEGSTRSPATATAEPVLLRGASAKAGPSPRDVDSEGGDRDPNNIVARASFLPPAIATTKAPAGQRRSRGESSESLSEMQQRSRCATPTSSQRGGFDGGELSPRLVDATSGRVRRFSGTGHHASFDAEQLETAKLPPEPRMSLWSFAAAEAFGERHSTGLDDSVPKAIDNFLAVPARFERFVAFGLLVCLDTFLDAVTLLPLRAVLAAIALVARGARRLPWSVPLRRRMSKRSRPRHHTVVGAVERVVVACARGVASLKFDRARAYDLMRFATVLSCLQCLKLVPMSQAYHWIRGQNTIKLYVIIGIMEVFDRLACAFGQDALDSLYLATRRGAKTAADVRRVALFLVVVNGVVLVHAGLLYVHITTLNVVVNASEDSAIVALLVSNNFSEIKSFVFKKYNARNLFEVACSDVCERFKLCLFLGLLVLLAWSQVAHGTDAAARDRRWRNMSGVSTQAAIVMAFEVVADWLKHAFMAKFNKLDATVYDAYADRLARDVVTGRGGGLALDHTHAVTRRLGLAVLPLTCVAMRYLAIAAGWLRLSLNLSTTAVGVIAAAALVCAFELKLLTSICLAGVSLQVNATCAAGAAAAAAKGGDRASSSHSSGGGGGAGASAAPAAAAGLAKQQLAGASRCLSTGPGDDAWLSSGIATHYSEPQDKGLGGPHALLRSARNSFDDPRFLREAKSPTSPTFRFQHRRQPSSGDAARCGPDRTAVPATLPAANAAQSSVPSTRPTAEKTTRRSSEGTRGREDALATAHRSDDDLVPVVPVGTTTASSGRRDDDDDDTKVGAAKAR